MASNKNMHLYWGSGSAPCWKVMLVLAEKGLWKDCPQKLVEFSKKEHKSEEVLKINPRGQVPTFRDGDIVVNESDAACFYLERKYADKGTKLIPDDEPTMALTLQYFFELNNIHSKIVERLMYYMFQNKDNLDKEELQKRYEEADKELKIWNDKLKGPYLTGEKFTMADIKLYPFVATLVRQGVVLDRYPNLKKYYDTCKSRPSAAETEPPHWKTDKSPNWLKDFTESLPKDTK